jgi:hypothetical protein
MAFVSAMNTTNQFKSLDLSDSDYESLEQTEDDDTLLQELEVKMGVNGSDVYTKKGFGNDLVSFYTLLNRGMYPEKIKSFMKTLLTKNKEVVVELLVLIFQTRDIRGGKGERDLFYYMLSMFLDTFPSFSYEILQQVPEYGYWKDLWNIYEGVCSEVKEQIDRVVKEQYTKDLSAEHPSLLAKWLPREKSEFDSLAKHFAEVFFPDADRTNSEHMRLYRKSVSDLNRRLQTTEIKMCGQTWADIVPHHVPGRLMKKNKDAFFNNPTKRQTRRNAEYRYPDNEDRMKCRKNFKEYVEELKTGKKVAKAANVLMPHELVKEVSGYAKDHDELIQAQWEAIRNDTIAGGGLDKCVFMCDFSGSMDGTPKYVSLALGILGSEIAHPDFKDYILTFDHNPVWHCFKGRRTLRDKVASVGSLGQGLNTDFRRACDLILQKLVEHKIPPSEAPTDLVVLTDMGFDKASEMMNSTYRLKKKDGWETHFEMIRESFKREGYKPPRIVCWNLRADFDDFHSKHDTVGVINLSGWSASAFKNLQKAGLEAMTPTHMLRMILDSPRYDPIRNLAKKLFST